jgi:hypothetical protein
MPPELPPEPGGTFEPAGVRTSSGVDVVESGIVVSSPQNSHSMTTRYLPVHASPGESGGGGGVGSGGGGGGFGGGGGDGTGDGGMEGGRAGAGGGGVGGGLGMGTVWRSIVFTM